MIVPTVTASGCLFCGVQGFCVSVRVPLQLFLSCRFQSGVCQSSSTGALLLIGRRDQCSSGFIWVFCVLSSYVFIISCVCMTHDVCIVLGSSLVFLVFFCYVLIGRKGLSYYFITTGEGISGWVEQDRLCQRSISNPVSNKGVNLKYEMS